MKKLIISSVTLLSLNAAHADIIKCVFTEPFVNTTYSMTQSTLTSDNESEQKVQTIKNVSFQIKSAGVFELVSKDGKVLQTLILNNQGSDGMSDNIFPYEVQDSTLATGANSGIGGCYSNSLKIIKK